MSAPNPTFGERYRKISANCPNCEESENMFISEFLDIIWCKKCKKKWDVEFNLKKPKGVNENESC